MNERFQVATDSLQAVVDSVFASSAFQWPERRDLFEPLRNAFNRTLEWLWALESARPSAYWAIMIAMVVILVAIIVHGAWIFRRTVRLQRRPAGARVAIAKPRDASWHLEEARRLTEAGRYAEALTHRFQATLRVLQDRQLLRLRQDRTPAEYVREARLAPDARQRFGHLVDVFYDVVFGGRACDLDGLRAFDGMALEVERSRASG